MRAIVFGSYCFKWECHFHLSLSIVGMRIFETLIENSNKHSYLEKGLGRNCRKSEPLFLLASWLFFPFYLCDGLNWKDISMISESYKLFFIFRAYLIQRDSVRKKLVGMLTKVLTRLGIAIVRGLFATLVISKTLFPD